MVNPSVPYDPPRRKNNPNLVARFVVQVELPDDVLEGNDLTSIGIIRRAIQEAADEFLDGRVSMSGLQYVEKASFPSSLRVVIKVTE